MKIAGTAVVTGAATGIGLATARALVALGFQVQAVGRRAEPLRLLAEEFPGRVSPLTADVATEQGVRAIEAALPPSLDVLVHSAGMFHHGPVATTPAATWTSLLGTNLVGPSVLTAACLPQLRRGKGQVVFVNSTAGLAGSPGNGAYAASKHALKAAVDVLRQELSADGIRVISVYPGRTDTPMQEHVLRSEGRVAADVAMLRPEQVADLIVQALAVPRNVQVNDLVVRPSS